MIEKLKKFLEELRALRQKINAEKFERISKKEIRTNAELLGSRWFSEFSTSLSQEAGISGEILDKYAEGCGRLIALSASNNLKASYIGVLDSLIRPFRNELILSIQKGTTTSGSLVLLHKILGELPNPSENDYLKEAISCAQRGYLRRLWSLGGVQRSIASIDESRRVGYKISISLPCRWRDNRKADLNGSIHRKMLRPSASYARFLIPLFFGSLRAWE